MQHITLLFSAPQKVNVYSKTVTILSSTKVTAVASFDVSGGVLCLLILYYYDGSQFVLQVDTQCIGRVPDRFFLFVNNTNSSEIIRSPICTIPHGLDTTPPFSCGVFPADCENWISTSQRNNMYMSISMNLTDYLTVSGHYAVIIVLDYGCQVIKSSKFDISK